MDHQDILDSDHIPHPPRLPIIGNLLDLDINNPLQGMLKIAAQQGPIFKMTVPGIEMIFVTSQAFVNELCDESRFDKSIHLPLEKLRTIAYDGLFTAYTTEPNWAKAHHILMPAFNPLAIRKMFPKMLDIAEQLLLKWERVGPDKPLEVTDNMTRLTLDTIALCAFNYRFNSFYTEKMDPFVNAMMGALHEASNQSVRLDIQTRLMPLTRRKYEQDISYLFTVADTLINDRRKKPRPEGSEPDLLDIMLEQKDPETGAQLSLENIRYQLITLLIAGHETTSGMLSFTIYELLQHEDVLQKAKSEIDRVLGGRPPTYEDLPKLTYLDQVLKESLRKWPTAPAFALTPRKDTVIGGKYPVKKDQSVMVLLAGLHRDKLIWGEDVEAFRPERFEKKAYEKLPPNAYKPFGNGQRACIGRYFAMQEATLILCLILQRFDLEMVNPAYKLVIKETLTIKPEDFYIKVKKRTDVVPNVKQHAPKTVIPAIITGGRKQFLILYGSNSGTCQSLAQQLTEELSLSGVKATLGVLNDYAGNIPEDKVILIVTASYEGQPANNAKNFVAALEELPETALTGLEYAVMGCGSRDWPHTYQSVPEKIDKLLARAGARAIVTRGEADASMDLPGDFDRWKDELWKVLIEKNDINANSKEQNTALYDIEIVKESRADHLQQKGLQFGKIIDNIDLTNRALSPHRIRKHITMELPPGMQYREGDYISILPSNPAVNVHRALAHFGFDKESQIIIHTHHTQTTSLPKGFPVYVQDVLTNYVELGQPVTLKQLQLLVDKTTCPPEQKKWEVLLSPEKYKQDVLGKRVSVLDVLEDNPSCVISFADFLSMLQPLKARQYSISSSPLWNPHWITLTVAVVHAPALSGKGNYTGVASGFLAAAKKGEQVLIATQPSNLAFHLPEHVQQPVIMICAGTGIAPFRGFIQQRALLKAKGAILGEALLFFGCTHSNIDYLYKDELEKWEQAGIVTLHPAFSRPGESEKGAYVQDVLWEQRAKVNTLIDQNAQIYVCGDGKYMAPAVRNTLIRIYAEAYHVSVADADKWMARFEHLERRYVADIY
jgi:cytochrome P450/NADPH-cytochrome P450 reductase